MQVFGKDALRTSSYRQGDFMGGNPRRRVKWSTGRTGVFQASGTSGWEPNSKIQSVTGTSGKSCEDPYGHFPRPLSSFPNRNTYSSDSEGQSERRIDAKSGSIHSLLVPLLPQIT